MTQDKDFVVDLIMALRAIFSEPDRAKVRVLAEKLVEAVEEEERKPR